MRGLHLRLIHVAVVLVLVAAGTFLLMSLLPGGPAEAILGTTATPESVARLNTQLGLDDPLPMRFASWLGDVVQGDLGTSLTTNRSVADEIGQRLPRTVEIMVVAQVLALSVAVPLAVIGAYRQGSWVDRLMSTTMFGVLAVPNFLLAIGLIIVVGVQLKWLPATGFVDLVDDPVANVRSVLLPATSLAAGEAAVYFRVLRSDVITTLQNDYLTLARAKGLPTWRLLTRHALRPSLLSLVTIVGLGMGRLIGGAVLIENLFAIPGIGTLARDSAFNRDYVTVQGVVLVSATAVVVLNVLADGVVRLLDPRVRHD